MNALIEKKKDTEETETEIGYVNEDGNTVLDLKTPISAKDGTEISQLIFRRPTAGDLQAMDEVKGDTAKSVRVLSRVCDLPLALISKLDGYDFMQAQGIVSGFLTRPR